MQSRMCAYVLCYNTSPLQSVHFSRCIEGVLIVVHVVAEDRCTHPALHDLSFTASKKRNFGDTTLTSYATGYDMLTVFARSH